MIRFIPFFLTVIFTIPIFSEPEWLNSLDKGLEKSRVENKPILVDLYTDWCAYCKDLENKVFPAKEVAAELEKYITVRINGEESPEVVTKYSVRGYPTILLLDKNGYFIDEITGLPGNAQLVAKLQEVYIKKDIELELIAEQKLSPNSVLSNYNLGFFYYKNENFKDSSHFLLKSFNASDKKYQEKKPEALFLLGLIQFRESKFPEAISTWNSFIEKYPKNKKDSVFYWRGIAYYALGKKQEAKVDLLKAKDFSTNEDQLEKIQVFLTVLEN